MIQNKNAIINQFLQGKQTNINYFNSLRTLHSNEPYFTKNVLNKTTKKVTPLIELHDEYIKSDTNKFKSSYYKNTNLKYKRHSYVGKDIKSENYSYNTSNDFTKIVSKSERRNSQIKTEISPEREYQHYQKTEDNVIKRAHSQYYQNTEEDKRYDYDYKTMGRNNVYNKKVINLIQPSTSLPSFSKSKLNFDENKNKSNTNYNNNSYKNTYNIKIGNEKTYNSSNMETNNYNHRKSLDDKSLSYSLNKINNNELEEINKKIKNFKNNTLKNKKNNFFDSNNHIYVNDIKDNNIDIKDNYKYHSINATKRKNNKDELGISIKNKYNIYSSQNKLNKKNNNIYEKISNSKRKIMSPKSLNLYKEKFNHNLTESKSEDKNDKKNEILKKYKNHSVFESINLSKKNSNEIHSKNNLYSKNNIKSNIKFKNIINYNRKLYSNISIDKNNLLGNIEKISKVNGSSSFNKMKKNKLYSKDISISYDSDYFEKNRNNAKINEGKKNIYNINKINYIYEGRNKKQK